MLKPVFIAAALIASTTTFAAEADPRAVSATTEMVTVTEVDFRGRPPFKRTRKQVPATDLAVLESAPQGEMVEVMMIDRRGAPPFRRYRTMVEVTDVAALEPVESKRSLRRRKAGHPPFGRH